MLGEGEAGALQPLRHVLGGDAEAAVGVVGAEFVQVMRREIDDEQAAAGLEDAGGFGQRRGPGPRGSAAPGGWSRNRPKPSGKGRA